MMPNISALALLFFIWWGARPVLGQTTPEDSLIVVELPYDIVVTGTRTQRDVAALPLPTQRIGAERIAATGTARLSELLQEQTGLMLVSDFGGGAGLQIQGLDAAYAMILIDGQPLIGRTAGTLDLARISVHNIERVEVVKGASSALYGSEALAGVVNIITKAGEADGQWHGMAGYRAASFGTHDASASLGRQEARWGFELSANYFASQGHDLSPKSWGQTVEPFHNHTLQGKGKWAPSPNLDIQWQGRHYAHVQDYRASIGGERFAGKSRTNEWNQSLLLKQKLRKVWSLEYDLYATRYRAEEYLDDAQGERFENNDYDQRFFRGELRALRRSTAGHTLSLGIGGSEERLDRNLFSQAARLGSAYGLGQYQYRLARRWDLLAGFRFDWHNQYRSQFSPKLGLSYRARPGLYLKASAGYGYKAPDLRQLYLDFTNSSVGYAVFGYNVAAQRLAELAQQGQLLFSNDYSFEVPLRPESAANYNAGAYYDKGPWRVESNLFINQLHNLIDTRAVAQLVSGQNVFSYFNINRIITYGLELDLLYRLGGHTDLHIGYQYLEAKDQSVLAQIEAGELFARDPATLRVFRIGHSEYFGLFNRSRHTANIKLSYRVPRWGAGLYARVIYRSRYGLFDTNNNTVLDAYDDFAPAYALLNLSFDKAFGEAFRFQFGLNNAFGFIDAANQPSLAGRQWFGRAQYTF